MNESEWESDESEWEPLRRKLVAKYGEDAAQEALVRVWQHPEHPNPTALAYVCARNAFITDIHKRNREPIIDHHDIAEDHQARMSQPPTQLEQASARQQLERNERLLASELGVIKLPKATKFRLRLEATKGKRALREWQRAVDQRWRAKKHASNV